MRLVLYFGTGLSPRNIITDRMKAGVCLTAIFLEIMFIINCSGEGVCISTRTLLGADVFIVNIFLIVLKEARPGKARLFVDRTL
jgi:hypothetical protein